MKKVQARAKDDRSGTDITKLNEEIKWLRQQRLFAVLALLGSVCAFVVSNSEKVGALIYRKPTIAVITEDEFLSTNGQVSITARSVKEPISVVREALSKKPRWFRVAPGAYTVSVKSKNDDSVFEQDFTLENNEQKLIVVPTPFGPHMRLSVDLQPHSPKINDQLYIKISSSGNGYLWVFEEKDGGVTYLYPSDCIANCGNSISAGREYDLPDRSNRQLYAGIEYRLTQFLGEPLNVLMGAKTLVAHGLPST